MNTRLMIGLGLFMTAALATADDRGIGASRPAAPSDYRAGETIRVNRGDTLTTDLFAGGRYISIMGVVAGDVFAGGQTTTIEGMVRDDVIAAGQELVVRGSVGDGIISFGESLLIEGEVHGDVIFFGGRARITESAVIHGNLLVYAGEVFLAGGRVEGRISGGCDRASLNGAVGANVELEAEHVTFGPGYSAGEGTKLTLGRELEDRENAPADLEVVVKPRRRFFQKGFTYWSFFSMLVVGIILVALFKNFCRDYLSIAEDNAAKSFGLGAVLLIAVPLAIVVLLALFLTIPLALIFAAGYLILLYLSSLFSAVFVGKYTLGLFSKDAEGTSLILYLILGLVLIFLLTELPFIGWICNLAIILFGMGSLVLHIWQLRRPEATTTA